MDPHDEEQVAKRIARVERVLVALLVELGGRADTAADIRNLAARDDDIDGLLTGKQA